MSEYSFGNPKPSLDLDQTWHDCVWPQKETFQPSRSTKNMTSTDGATRPFLLKISKNLYLFRICGNQLISVSWIISKFGIKIPGMCGHVTGRLKFRTFCAFTRFQSPPEQAQKQSTIIPVSIHLTNFNDGHQALSPLFKGKKQRPEVFYKKSCS